MNIDTPRTTIARGAAALLLVVLTTPLWAQSTATSALAPGKFLVAGRNVLDPNFVETVILLIDYDEKGALGLIVNRATNIKLSALLPQIKGIDARPDTIYVGGPVETSRVWMLLRAKEPPAGADRVFADVNSSASRDLLEKTIGNRGDRQVFRVYGGYSGWGPGQLDNEVKRGDWFILPAAAATVFDPDPDGVWKKLIQRSSVRFAD